MFLADSIAGVAIAMQAEKPLILLDVKTIKQIFNLRLSPGIVN